MQMRRAGRSGLKVSAIGLGCNNFGRRNDEAETRAIVDAAIDAGINFFDTADVYGSEQSEVFLGRALGKRRHDVVVATKFGMQMANDPRRQGGSRGWIMRAVEGSLTRLGTDYIDLYQFHFPDPETPLDETLRALDDLVTQGKVRYIGQSNFAGWQIADADWVARTAQINAFVSAQNEYSLLQRSAETEVLPACEKFGLGFLPYFPLAAGMLSGKYKRGERPADGTRLATMPVLGDRNLNERNFDVVEKLEDWARARGHTILDLAFAWLLARPVVSSVIAGATSPDQVRMNAATATWMLTPEEANEVSEIAG